MPLSQDRKTRPYRPHLVALWRPLVVLAVVMGVVAAGLAALVYEYEVGGYRHRARAVAEFRSQQLSAWLAERLQSASLHASSFPQAELYQRWSSESDTRERERLFLRLTQFASAGGFASVTLLDASGRLLWSRYHAGGELPEETRRRVLEAAASEAPSAFVGLYRDAGGEVHLDFVARLPTPEPAARPIVLLHAGSDDFLPADFHEFPSQRGMGHVVLCRLEGDEVVLLSDLHPEKAGDGILSRRPVAGTALAALAEAGSQEGPVHLEGVGLRGLPMQGAAAGVAGTDWWVLATIDRRTLLLAVLPMLLGVVTLIILLYLAIVAILVILRQQRLLARSVAEQNAQAARLRGLQLVSAIAESSTDCIYVKDVEGRYLMFNQASSEFTGQPPEAAIGRDDYFLFPPDQAAELLATHRRVLAENRSVTVEEEMDSVLGRRVVLATKGPLRGEDGTLIGVYGIAHDVTEEKISAAELERRKEELARQNEKLLRFNRAMVGRELEMRRLKQQVNKLARELGRSAPYPSADQRDE